MEISKEKLNSIVIASSYLINGDYREKQYSHHLSTSFSNSEVFWKYLIVPFTNRIIETIDVNSPLKIYPRANIAIEVQEIGSFHYSVFLNLAYAYKVFESKHPSFFENFYTHLGSVCDSVEELLIKIYFLILQCTNEETAILQRLSKRKFLQIAEEWYNNNYSNAYTYYLSKGKPPPIKLIGRNYILDEYFTNHIGWKEYKSFTNKIKEYRNVIVHNYQIGYVQDNNGVHYVPKKEKIQNYKKWNEVFKAANDGSKLSKDFAIRESQMMADIDAFKAILQTLWTKPINDLKKLLYTDENPVILTKYDLTII